VHFPVREPESDFLFLNQHSSSDEWIDVLCYLNLRSFSEITPYACSKRTEMVYFQVRHQSCALQVFTELRRCAAKRGSEQELQNYCEGALNRDARSADSRCSPLSK